MFQRAEPKQLSLKMLIYGSSGAGKTFTALKLASNFEKSIAVINTESDAIRNLSGIAPDQIPWEFDICDIKDSQSLFLALENAKSYGTVIIDSLSVLENSITASNQVKFTELLRKHGSHVICTARVGESETAPYLPHHLEYEFDLIAKIDVNHQLTIIKSRYPNLKYSSAILPTREFAIDLITATSLKKPTQITTPNSNEDHQTKNTVQPIETIACANVPTETPSKLDSTNNGALSSRMTLMQFFEHWYLPVELVANKAKKATIKSYTEALAHWVRITNDPSLDAITDAIVANFMKEMNSATYRRGKRGKEHKMSLVRIAKHFTHLNSLFSRTGPRFDHRKKTTNLLNVPPYLKIPKTHPERKLPFTPVQVLSIAAATDEMIKPFDRTIATKLFWKGFIATLYYTGLRKETVLSLKKSMYRLIDGERWIIIEHDRDANTKAVRTIRIKCHEQLVTILDMLCAISSDEKIIDSKFCYRYLSELHLQLQKRAGIPEHQRQSPHAWRRTHADVISSLGYNVRIDITRRSLNHTSSATTERHYVDLTNKVRMQMPNIFNDLSSLKDAFDLEVIQGSFGGNNEHKKQTNLIV